MLDDGARDPVPPPETPATPAPLSRRRPRVQPLGRLVVEAGSIVRSPAFVAVVVTRRAPPVFFHNADRAHWSSSPGSLRCRRPRPMARPTTGDGDRVAPLLGSQRHVPSRRRPLGLHRSVRFPQAGGRGQVDLHHEFSSLGGPSTRRDRPLPNRSRRRRCTSSGSTPTATPSPTLPIRCASRLPRTEARRRRCAASRGHSRSGRATVARVLAEGVPVSTGREARVTEAGDHRVFVGRRSDPFFFDVLGVLQELQVHRRGFFRRQGHLQRRVGSAQLGAGVEGG